MTKRALDAGIALLLLVCIVITGLLGYIQSQLDLRRFFPHKTFAYATLILASLHVALNWKRLWNLLSGKKKRNKIQKKMADNLKR